MAYTNRVFNWDFNALRSFFQDYVLAPLRSLVGFYTCSSEASAQAKSVAAPWFTTIREGGSMKVKMVHRNTAHDGVTLAIGASAAIPLFYDGAPVSDTNSWEDNETVEVYYDGLAFQANNVAGGGTFASGQRVKTVSIEAVPVPGSTNIPTGGGVYNAVSLSNSEALNSLVADIILKENVTVSFDNYSHCVAECCLPRDNKFHNRLAIYNDGEEPLELFHQEYITLAEAQGDLGRLLQSDLCYLVYRQSAPSSQTGTAPVFNRDIAWGSLSEHPVIKGLLTQEGVDAQQLELSALQEDVAAISDGMLPVTYLPKRVYGVIGEKMQLFVRGIVLAPSPYGFFSRFSAHRGSLPGQGRAYRRCFEVTPALVNDDIPLLSVSHAAVGGSGKATNERTAKLVLCRQTEIAVPAGGLNVLCVGTGTTVGGQWPAELFRRLTADDGTPVGYGLQDIHFIGRVSPQGHPEIGIEATEGWTWADFCAPDNNAPFYDGTAGRPSFLPYANTYGNPDVVCLYMDECPSDVETAIADAKVLVDALHADCPDCKVLIGCGFPTTDDYDKNRLSFAYVQAVENWLGTNHYKHFCFLVDTFTEVDAELARSVSTKLANNRSGVLEVVTDEGLSDTGYLMVADCFCRAFACCILTGTEGGDEPPTEGWKFGDSFPVTLGGVSGDNWQLGEELPAILSD